MTERYSVHVVDDDPVMLALLVHCLSDGGFDVTPASSGEEALDAILEAQPDCVVLDIMMPGMDDLEVCRRLRAAPQLSNTRIVMMSGKSYEPDRRRALSLGVDAYIPKPMDPDHFAERLRRIVEDRIHMVFWGVRGTLPVAGPNALRYGGNTSCVGLEFARGPMLVFDAGTGIKALSDHLMAAGRTRVDVKILITHPHWDHINALPFFAPLYTRGSSVEIMGPCQGSKCVEDFLKEQMDGVYFPITAQEFGARVNYRDLREERFEIDRMTIRTMLLNHPGHCLGYRVQYDGRIICYITDNEIYPKESGLRDQGYVDKLEEFVAKADALIIDATYRDGEYRERVNWGHSPLSEVVGLAHRAGVGTLYLFHHDPDQDDDAIAAKLEEACSQLERLSSATKCVAPAEGQLLSI
jgi:CheY-like chemotaxis protein/phosphoribosyl 1,2-cyclic phosphodiesterase